ncbi:MAG: hypothetical protein ACKO2V_17715 [Snowella sp.]
MMTSETQVKQYLAYWFQLGKKIVLTKSGETVIPEPIFAGQHYSLAFESCWQRILLVSADAYLEGTNQTIEQLLSPAWEFIPCARCTMPVPASNTTIPFCYCPCQDLASWPNLELPLPRIPTDTQQSLSTIHQRLLQRSNQE